MGMPSFASSSQSDTGVTRATLTPGTLILNKDSHPTVTDIKSLGINTELSLANQQVDKPNIDKLKESQEIAALTGQVGSFAVGELGQRMGLEEGSWQKAALHSAVGALSAQLSKGNVKAGAAAGAATEVINTQIANALATHTDLSPQARNNLQQVTAMVAGATAGNLVGNNTNSTVQGANTGLASEVFNRQLHPSEIQRIKELANGDKEKEQRLLVASCALVHCSAHLSEDNPAYQEMKAREVLGGTAEYATERALLSKQTQRLSDAWGAGTTQPLFNYNGVYATKDKATAFDEKYAFTTRTLGAAQSASGAAIMVASYGGVVAACKLSVGIACGPAVAAGAAGATYGLDNLNAGAKSLVDGKPHATWGAQAISKTFGVPLDSAELLYSLPSLAGGAKTLAQGSKVVVKPVIGSAKNYSAKIPEEANANSKLPPVGQTKGYENQDYSKDVANLGVNRNKGLNERISNRQKDHYINEQATKNVHKVTAPIDFDGHILNAEIKGKKVVGGHSIANGNIRVDKVVKAPNANGVYEAKISVRDPNNPGKFLSKTNNNGKSTMFPDSWTSDRIKVEVDYAYKNRVPHPDPLKASKGMWQGVTKSGVKVEGYVSPKTTVYPLM